MDESHLSGKEIVPPGGVALVSTNRCEKERDGVLETMFLSF